MHEAGGCVPPWHRCRPGGARPDAGHAVRARRWRVRGRRRPGQPSPGCSRPRASTRRPPWSCARRGGHGRRLADAHRRLRARAVLRPLRVRGRATCSAPRTSRAGRWPSSSTLADAEAAAMWRRPPARLHGVARPPAAAARDRRAVREHRSRRGRRVQRRRGGDLRLANIRARAGRPRDRHVARLPEPARGRAGIRRRRDAPRAAGVRRLGDRRRRCCAARSRRGRGSSWSTRRTTRPATSRRRDLSGGRRRSPRTRARSSCPTRCTGSSSSTPPTGCRPAPTSARTGCRSG